MGVMGIERKPWSYADDAKLRELWETTPSSKLAAIFGRSRNAVIGRAHRMKLPPKRFRSGNKTKSAPKRAVTQKLRTSGVTNQRPTSLPDRNVGAIQFQSRSSSRRSEKPVTALPPVLVTGANSVRCAADAGAGEISPFAPLAPVALPVPLLELTARSCRYIVEGEGEYALFCNAPRLEHGPYCPSHAARCYTAPERRRVT